MVVKISISLYVRAHFFIFTYISNCKASPMSCHGMPRKDGPSSAKCSSFQHFTNEALQLYTYINLADKYLVQFIVGCCKIITKLYSFRHTLLNFINKQRFYIRSKCSLLKGRKNSYKFCNVLDKFCSSCLKYKLYVHVGWSGLIFQRI